MKSFKEMQSELTKQYPQITVKYYETPMVDFEQGVAVTGIFMGIGDIPWDHVRIRSFEKNEITGEYEMLGLPCVYQLVKFLEMYRIKPNITALSVTPTNKSDIGKNKIWSLNIEAFNTDGTVLEKVPESELATMRYQKSDDTTTAIMAQRIRERIGKSANDLGF